MIIGVRGKSISCNSVFLYFVFVFSSDVRSISVGARVRFSSVCGAPPPLLECRDGWREGWSDGKFDRIEVEQSVDT